jgi:hypothetical protein
MYNRLYLLHKQLKSRFNYVVQKEARRVANRLNYSGLVVEELPVTLAPSDGMIPLDVFDQKFLIENPSRERWLSRAEALFPFDGLKFQH